MYAEPAGALVRRATQDDLEALSELVYRFYVFNEEFDPSWSAVQSLRDVASQHAAELIRSQDSVVLVAVKEGKVIGYVMAIMEENRLIKARRLLVIKELYVRPQERRQGIATLLINRVLDEARKSRVSYVAVEYPAANTIAGDIYLKMGFRPHLVRLIKEV